MSDRHCRFGHINNFWDRSDHWSGSVNFFCLFSIRSPIWLYHRSSRKYKGKNIKKLYKYWHWQKCDTYSKCYNSTITHRQTFNSSYRLVYQRQNSTNHWGILTTRAVTPVRQAKISIGQ